MVLEFFLRYGMLKKNCPNIIVLCLPAPEQSHSVNPLLIAVRKRILNYWIVSHSVIFIRRAIPVIQGEATRVFWLPHHSSHSLGTPLLVGFAYFLFRLRFYLKIKGFGLMCSSLNLRKQPKTQTKIYEQNVDQNFRVTIVKNCFPLPKFSSRRYLHSSLSPSGLYSIIRVPYSWPTPPLTHTYTAFLFSSLFICILSI